MPRIFAVVPAPTNRPPDITPEMCVAGRDLTEPKLAPDGSSIAFVATSAGSSAIVVVAADGGPERLLTTLPLPAAGRGLGGGCFDWLPDGSGIVYAAVGGELWLHSIAGGAVRRLTRHGPDARVEAPMVGRDASFAVYAVDQAEVWRCWIDRDLPAERLDDGSADFCFDPAIAVDGTAAMWTGWNVPDMPWDAARVEHLTFDGSQRTVSIGAGGVHQPRAMPDGSTITVRDDTGWLNVWVGDRPLVDEPHEHAGPSWGMGQRSYAVSPDG